MQSIEIRFVFLFLFLYSANGLHKCVDSHENDSVNGRVLKEYSEALPYQNELEQLFDAFDANDTQRMNNIFEFLATVDTSEQDDSESTDSMKERIKYVPDRIKAEGYPAEDHKVVTDDGYILHVYRIPYGKKSPQTDKPRPPVFIMHGLFDGSNSWIALGSENSLAYLLADAGYDVWLGNARGTEPSREHIRLNPKGLRQKEYWSFSWHQIGVHDLPTCIDYILNKTNHKKLNYIGFSQGTTTFFVMASMRPEYNDKILEAQLMAPVANLKDQRSKGNNIFARYYLPLKKALEILRVYKLTISNKLVSKVAEVACERTKPSNPYTCKLFMSLLGSKQIDCSSLQSILVNTPAGASVQQGAHYLQMIRGGEFNQFDYENVKINRKMYGRDTPPPYNLTQISAPVNVYYSKDDTTATMENALKLQSQIQNLKSYYLIDLANFTHVDFTYSRHVRKAINERIISNMNKVNQF